MAFLKVKNRAFSTLSSGISDSDTTLTVATGEGSKFPDSGNFHITIEDEILECTSRSGDVLTVTRGAESTTPAPHSAGKEVSLNITAEIIEELQEHTHNAAEIEVSKLSGTTYDDVQDWINNTQSSGRISGGDITDNGDGSVTVAAGTGFIKISDSEIAETKFFDWAEDDNVSLVDNSINYIYVDYNSGSPQILATTDRTAIRLTDQFTLGRVYRNGTTLHILDVGVDLFNQIRREHERLLTVRGFERGSGGEISETGQRYLKSTAGVFYLGHKKITTPAQDTSGTDKFTAWYYNGSAWVSVADQTQISNTQYNDTSSGLSNLSVNKYGVHWIYIDYDGYLHSIYGQGDYKLAEAELALAPGDIPDILDDFAILVAKIIVKKDATNFTSVVSAYDTLFPISTPFEHNDLSGMQGGTADEYYHLTQSQHDNNVIKTGSLTAGQIVKVNADGVVEDASNTDAEVVDAVSKKHTQGTDIIIKDADGDTKIQVEESADEDKIRFDTGGAQRMIIDDSGNVGIGVDSPSQKLAVAGSVKVTTLTSGNAGVSVDVTGTGWGSSNKAFMAVAADGTEGFSVQLDGDTYFKGKVGIGTDSPATHLHLYGIAPTITVRSTNDSSGLRINVESTASNIFRVQYDYDTKFQVNASGTVFMPDVYGDALSYPTRDLYINESGQLGYISSSLRYKKNISDIGNLSEKIYRLRPVQFRWKSNNSKDYGLIAEEVEKVLPCIVTRNEEGQPESVEYTRLIPFLLNEIIRLRAEIKN